MVSLLFPLAEVLSPCAWQSDAANQKKSSRTYLLEFQAFLCELLCRNKELECSVVTTKLILELHSF